MTATFLFLVNPELVYDPYPDWERWAPLIEKGASPVSRWNTGTRRHGMSPGDRGVIVRVGREPRGLVGTCVITSEITVGPHWNPEARSFEAGYVDIAMTSVFDLDDPVTLDELRQAAPGVVWTPRQSGTRVPDEAAEALWNILFPETGFLAAGSS
ncbi:hypothetical protein [Flaviflexus huanghaiensis]|uniref:hypothetical protein n=1 Tax=Flaviflexus huanghaiensis TaxID=1111473 RepID=UPI0015FD0D50|nr:hypothetical protein [Flaviflexus huanghaiensis]